MTEEEYAAEIERQRCLGRRFVHRETRKVRRELWGPFPDPIDREDLALLRNSFAAVGESFRKVTEAAQRMSESLMATMPEPQITLYPEKSERLARQELYFQARYSLPIVNPARAFAITVP